MTFSQLFFSHLPWFWLAMTITLILIECFTMSLTTIWFALGALVTIFIAFTPLPFVWQILIFVIISTIILIFTRPVAKRFFEKSKTNTNSDSLIGQLTQVETELTELKKGTVKINGIEWLAKTKDNQAVARGTKVQIDSIEGNTLIVSVIQ